MFLPHLICFVQQLPSPSREQLLGHFSITPGHLVELQPLPKGTMTSCGRPAGWKPGSKTNQSTSVLRGHMSENHTSALGSIFLLEYLCFLVYISVSVTVSLCKQPAEECVWAAELTVLPGAAWLHTNNTECEFILLHRGQWYKSVLLYYLSE